MKIRFSHKPKLKKARKIGLVLGSGSARGWAHIGVIRALDIAGVDIGCIAGSSIGALIGATYALGKMDPLEDFARHLDWRQIVSFLDLVFPRSGLIDGGAVTRFFRSYMSSTNIEDLPIPFSAVATNLNTGREHVISRGDLIEAIRASISVPGVFTPARLDGELFVDGGLVNPVPVSAARRLGADYVIAVDLNRNIVLKRESHDKAPGDTVRHTMAVRPPAEKLKLIHDLSLRVRDISQPVRSHLHHWLSKDPTPSIFEVLTNSIDIMETQITAVRMSMDPPDLLIQPRVGHIRFLDFNKAEETIAEGYHQTMVRLKELNVV